MMSRFVKLAILIGVCQFIGIACSVADESEQQGKVVTTTAKSGKQYYHLAYTINADNMVKIDQLTKQQFDEAGGQFEVFLNKQKFPISAPKCKSNIILRMPWSDESNHALEAKYALYQQLTAQKPGAAGKGVTVYIELNPYVKKQGDAFSLTQCNVFFRHNNNGEYLPKLD